MHDEKRSKNSQLKTQIPSLRRQCSRSICIHAVYTCTRCIVLFKPRTLRQRSKLWPLYSLPSHVIAVIAANHIVLCSSRIQYIIMLHRHAHIYSTVAWSDRPLYYRYTPAAGRRHITDDERDSAWLPLYSVRFCWRLVMCRVKKMMSVRSDETSHRTAPDVRCVAQSFVAIRPKW